MSKNIKEVLVETLGVPNRNGRIYSEAVISGEIEKFNAKAPVIGEFGSPTGDEHFSINLSRASHLIHELKIKDDKIYADVQILSTPMGKQAEQLINSGANRSMGLGLRGSAHAKFDGEGNQIITDFNLITIDIVKDPLPGYELPADFFTSSTETAD